MTDASMVDGMVVVLVAMLAALMAALMVALKDGETVVPKASSLVGKLVEK